MAEKFKVGDLIRRKDGVTLSDQEGVITHISQRSSVGHVLTIRRTNTKTAIWYGIFCQLVEKKEEQEKLCRCDIQILMRKGCQCGCRI